MIPYVDHIAAGLARQRPVYRSASTDALLVVYLRPLQELSDVIREFLGYLEQGLGGSGWALDLYGARIGVKRQGRGDPEYKLALAARVGLINSEGGADDLLRLLRALLPATPGARAVQRRLRGATYIRLTGQVVSRAQLVQLQALLEPAASSGTRVLLGGPAVEDALSFRFGSWVRAASAAALGDDELQINPLHQIPATGWVQVPSNPVIAYRRTSPGTLTLAATLSAGVSAGAKISLTDSDGAPARPGLGWGVGRMGGVAG